MFENPYEILNINNNATIDEIKKAYRKIALKSHPDKLNNITDPEERKNKIKEFTDATNAYNQLLNNEGCEFQNYDYNYDDWEKTFDKIVNSKLFKDFISNLMKPCSKVISHTFNLDITYSEYFNKNKKKIRIFLKDCEEPIYLELDCKKFPKAIISHIDDNDNEHEIIFNMNIISNNKNYYHIENKDKSIDIIHDMMISTVEYITGNIREHAYLNKEILIIKIEPFAKQYEIEGLGINNGKFICNFIYIPIDKNEWNRINDEDKKTIIRIFNSIK
jgi:curved DNA-binding protein CbpA